MAFLKGLGKKIKDFKSEPGKVKRDLGKQETLSPVTSNGARSSMAAFDLGAQSGRDNGIRQLSSVRDVGRDELVRLHDPLPIRPSTVIGTKETFARHAMESLSPSQTDFLSKLDAPRIRFLLETLRKLPNSGTECEEMVRELRTLSKTSRIHRMCLSENGAAEVVLNLLDSEDKLVVEHSVTTLLNLALELQLKSKIGTLETILKLSKLMETAETEMARENAAGAICNLCVSEESRLFVKDVDAIPKLLNLTNKSKTNIVRRDAVVGLLNLSLDNRCRDSVVEIGTVNSMMELLTEPGLPFEDEVMALIATLVKSSAGRQELENQNAVTQIIEVLESGSVKGRAAAVAILLQIAEKSEKGRLMVVKEGIIATLVVQAASTTGRGQEKAQQLLVLLRGNSKSP